jgi:hypothetical protein
MLSPLSLYLYRSREIPVFHKPRAGLHNLYSSPNITGRDINAHAGDEKLIYKFYAEPLKTRISKERRSHKNVKVNFEETECEILHWTWLSKDWVL